MKVRQKKSYVKIFWIVNFFWKKLLEKMKEKIKRKAKKSSLFRKKKEAIIKEKREIKK